LKITAPSAGRIYVGVTDLCGGLRLRIGPHDHRVRDLENLVGGPVFSRSAGDSQALSRRMAYVFVSSPSW
jgi:hypothetical protein